jgi:hypothetical protein
VVRKKSAPALSLGAVAAGVRSGRHVGARPRPSPSPGAAGTAEKAEKDKAEAAVPKPPEADARKDGDFRWTLGRSGDWIVSGPAGFAGQKVTVVKKKGGSSSERLDRVLWSDKTRALYTVKQRD